MSIQFSRFHQRFQRNKKWDCGENPNVKTETILKERDITISTKIRLVISNLYTEWRLD